MPTVSWALGRGKAMQIPNLAAFKMPWIKPVAALKLLSVRVRFNPDVARVVPTAAPPPTANAASVMPKAGARI